jgi:DNA-binding response OmpR family regulator
MKVLIVEDEPRRHLFSGKAINDGRATPVQLIRSCAAARDAFAGDPIDAVILDLLRQ